MTGLAQELKHLHKAPDVHTTTIHPTWARTPLLGVNQAIIEKGFGGLIDPEVIADAVVGQVLACRGGQLVLPGSLNLLACIRSFPNWLQEIIRDQPGRIKW